jgi:hypothetical protein
MSTARNRFGVSILVGFVLAVLCTLGSPARAAEGDPTASVFSGREEGSFDIDVVMTAASSRMQLAVGIGAGVPILLIGMMVRRRNQAEY